MPCGGQNIDSTRLVAKILRNKGLGTAIGSSSGDAELVLDCFGSVRTIPILRAPKSSVKVVRHKIAVFFCGWLWKSEEAQGSAYPAAKAGVQLALKEDRQTARPPSERTMSLLLHVLGNVVFFSVLAVVVLTLMTWLTKKPKSNRMSPPALAELPEDKATYVDRISARRPYSSSRQDLMNEQKRRRA